METTTSALQNWTNHTPCRRDLLLIVFGLAFFVLAPSAPTQTCPTLCDDNSDTALGENALRSLTTGGGIDNTAIGYFALGSNTGGSENTAVGSSVLDNNTNGEYNTAIGGAALVDNTMGNKNTASGALTLEHNTMHSYNTATGFNALNFADADDNTALGALALSSDTSGYYNTATGVSALFSNTTGYYNVASGVSALYYNVAGHDNVAIGLQALLKNKGSNNIAVGSNAGANLTTGNNNIDIGSPATAGEGNTIRVGKSGMQQKTFIAGISGKTVANGVGVIINSSGQLGTVLSSARFKTEIKPMNKASEAILALKPVTFHYKQELDPDKVPQFGLIAEEVEKVNPDLVVRDEDGKVMAVRYDAVNAMLLNEFLKEYRRAEQQERRLRQQESKILQQEKQIEALTCGLQKLSDNLEPSQSTAAPVNTRQ